MTLEELNEEARTLDLKDQGPISQERPPVFYGDSSAMFLDLSRGVDLIRQAATLLLYISDKELCKGVSLRERASMVKMAQRMSRYLVDVEPAIDEIHS